MILSLIWIALIATILILIEKNSNNTASHHDSMPGSHYEISNRRNK